MVRSAPIGGRSVDCSPMTRSNVPGDKSRPPESIDEPPIDLDAAARLMADAGFVLFRTPPGSPTPESCLMVVIRDVPSERHFDAEVASFWVTSDERGQLQSVDRKVRLPFSRPYSWGRIRIVDRLGARNSFVGFGGEVTGESVGAGARLLIFRSPAMIFRLTGHSQREDRLAQEVLTFFGRIVPHLWTPDVERRVSSASPLDLYSALLLHTRARVVRSRALREALGGGESFLHREIALMEATRPDRLQGGRLLLAALELPLDSA